MFLKSLWEKTQKVDKTSAPSEKSVNEEGNESTNEGDVTPALDQSMPEEKS
jgi:hypothetical protein